MQPEIVAGIISGVATLIAGAFSWAKWGSENAFKSRHVESSNFVIGDNANQINQGDIHNHISLAPSDVEFFKSKAETKPTPLDIRRSIEATKPFDRDHVASNYVGLIVCWPVKFTDIWWDSAQEGTVTFHIDREYITVHARVTLEFHPKIKVIDSGHRAWIEGKIESVMGHIIELEPNPTITLE